MANLCQNLVVMRFHKKVLFIVIALSVIVSSILLIRAAGGGDGGGEVNCSQDPGACINRGLVGYWDFEEGEGQTAYDRSAPPAGGGNNGTLGADANPGSDDPQWTTAGGLPSDALISGRGALDFDGSNDHVDTNAVVIPANDFSATFWINGDTLSGTDIILGQYGTGY